jgi:isoleucyl-tRNA synthetase
VEGKIGSSLQAEVLIHADGDKYEALASLGDDLRFVLICSKATLLRAAEEKLVVSALPHGKCERCWHVREDVGANTEHPELCGRCINNLFGEGETRAFA